MQLPRDRRLGEPWTRRQTLKNALIYWLIRGALSIGDRLPRAAILGLGRALGSVAHRMLGGARRNAERGLRLALGDPLPREAARTCFARAGENLGVILLLRRPEMRASDWVHLGKADRAVVEQALSLGRGAIFVSAHLGPFELVAALMAELGFKPAVVVRESYDPRLDPLVDRHRRARGVEVIHRGKPGAAARIRRALRQGRPVGFLTDLGGRVQRAPVEFLGWKVEMPIGPCRIALCARAPVIVGTLQRRSEFLNAGNRAREASVMVGSTGLPGHGSSVPGPRPADDRSTVRKSVLVPVGPRSDRPPGRLLLDGPKPFILRVTRADAPDEPALRQRVATILSQRIRMARLDWLWMAPGFPWLRDDSASPYTETASMPRG